jgi:histidine ammonia-lyase
MGPPVDDEVVRATMLLRARTLSMGLSGVRPAVAEALIALLNAKLTPVVPRHGSVGCSGDLAPLAHIALALVGEGEVVDAEGVTRPALQALKAAKVKPLKLETKEGLSLINGTDGMLGMLALACADAERCFRIADITAAMSAEALMGTDRTFQKQLHEIRPHAGQVASAANLIQMLRGSGIVASPSRTAASRPFAPEEAAMAAQTSSAVSVSESRSTDAAAYVRPSRSRTAAPSGAWVRAIAARARVTSLASSGVRSVMVSRLVGGLAAARCES